MSDSNWLLTKSGLKQKSIISKKQKQKQKQKKKKLLNRFREKLKNVYVGPKNDQFLITSVNNCCHRRTDK